MILSSDEGNVKAGWKNPKTGELELVTVKIVDNKGATHNVKSLIDVVKKLYDVDRDDIMNIMHFGFSQFHDASQAEAFTVGYLTKAVMIDYEAKKGIELKIETDAEPFSKSEAIDDLARIIDNMKEKMLSNPDEFFDSFFGIK